MEIKREIPESNFCPSPDNPDRAMPFTAHNYDVMTTDLFDTGPRPLLMTDLLPSR